jgi:hypothetical protein
MNMGGWVGGFWGKGIEALNFLQIGKAYNGRMNTQTEALITRRETTPLIDRYDVTDSPQRMWPA